MAAVNVDKLSLKDLLDLEARVEKALGAARERERSDIKQKVEAMAAQAGFSLGELFGGRGTGRTAKSAAVKFMNPENRSETWTGRGRKPNWLVAKLAKGASMDDFAA
jgi:DNA-binding protein H-NS